MFRPKQLLDAGFSGQKIGELIKQSKNENWTEDEVIHFLNTKDKPFREKENFSIRENSVLWWFINNPCVSTLLNSSNSQKRRWLDEGAVLINGEKLKPNDEMPQIDSLVFFPASKLRITMV